MKVFRTILFVLAWLGMAAAEVFAAARLWKLSVLPLRYKLLICVGFMLVWVLAGLLFFLGNAAKRGQHPGLWRRIIAWILALITVGGSLYSVRVADQLDETLSKVTEKTRVSSTIAVFVLKDDPAQTISDASDYLFGMTSSYDTANTRKALSNLMKTLGTVRTEEFEAVVNMVDALYSGDVDAVILNEGYVSILEDLDNYGNFSEETRILYEIQIEESTDVQIPVGTPGEADDIGTYDTSIENLKPVNDVTQEPFVVYLSGSDTRSKMLSTSRSDVNILVVVNPKSKQILLLNTPRDYYVPNPAGGGALDKLTHCGIYGIGCSIGALSNLYDVPVNYYAQINFTGFETLIDAIGGVTVHSDSAYTTNIGHYEIAKGENHLNGKQALGFVRERYSFASGDRQRGENQMIVLSAVIDKLSTGTIIMHHSEILNSMQGMFITNLSSDEISGLVKMQLSDGADWNVKTFAVTGGDGSEYTYSIPSMRAYVMYQDESYVNRGAKLVQRVLAGETLTEKDVA